MFIMFHSPGSMSLFLWDWWNTIKNLRFCPSPFWVRWYGEIIRINITWQFFDPSRWSSIRFPLWDHIYILNHVEHCTLCVVHVTMKILYYSLLINYYSMSSFSLRHPTYPHLSPFQTASSPCGPGEIANMIGLTRPYTEITYVRYLHWAVPNILVGSLRVFWYIVINSYIYILLYTCIYYTPFFGMIFWLIRENLTRTSQYQLGSCKFPWFSGASEDTLISRFYTGTAHPSAVEYFVDGTAEAIDMLRNQRTALS